MEGSVSAMYMEDISWDCTCGIIRGKVIHRTR
jgi:hypothetical protein